MRMKQQILTWMRRRRVSNYQDHHEWLWLIGLLLGAMFLYGAALGNLPLRDWDEGTVAQVAKEIWQASPGDMGWLFPTLWGEPYWNKPPLIHNLIAIGYGLFGVSEFTTRLPGAMLTAISVPLLYCVGREIFPSRPRAVLGALVYLTLLPVVRHGRLAMLDGAVLCFECLTILCILRTRRDWRWALGAGISLSLLGLTKGIMSLLVGTIALLFLAWDTPRLLKSVQLWLGLLCGSLPLLAWYLSQWFHSPGDFLATGIVAQSLQRIWSPVEGHQGKTWYYLLELMKYPWPWLIFMVGGLQQAWQNRNWGWAKLVLVWSTFYLVVVSSMMTKLPWYILPIYPALALAAGAQLAQVYEWPSFRPYPRFWAVFLSLLSVVALGGCVYFGLVHTNDRSLLVIMAAIMVTTAVSTVLIYRQDRQFLIMLFWGMYICLLLFVTSQHWIWELNEAYPVKPVAALIKITVPSEQTIYTAFDYERPSLNFYSERRVLAVKDEQLELLEQELPSLSPVELKLHWLKDYWQSQPQPYLLLTSQQLEDLDVSAVDVLGKASDWLVISKSRN